MLSHPFSLHHLVVGLGVIRFIAMLIMLSIQRYGFSEVLDTHWDLEIHLLKMKENLSIVYVRCNAEMLDALSWSRLYGGLILIDHFWVCPPQEETHIYTVYRISGANFAPSTATLAVIC